MDAEKLIDNFSKHLKNVIANSIELAINLKQEMITPFHLLLNLKTEQGAISAEILKDTNLNPDFLFNLIKEIKLPKLKKNQIPIFSPETNHIIEKSLIIGYKRQHNYIGTEHLLYSILDFEFPPLKKFFKDINLNTKQIKEQLELALQNDSRFSQFENTAKEIENTLNNTQNERQNMKLPSAINNLNPLKKQQTAIELFTNNLVFQAKHKKIDPVIGREKEIERLINILARRQKNNPILIGEPGVGKTAIVEGLAKKIAEKQVPPFLINKEIIELDLTLLIAGTIYRGEFEARLKQIIDEVAANPKYILFIDEIHNIIGTGSNQGTMDAANILKPALARGQLRCIGSTTHDEYKKYILKDPALERRFQSIIIKEPNKNQTIKILTGIKKYYEEFHHLIISNLAIETAVELSNRFIHNQFQPDKSIDLIDEACASVKTKLPLTDLEKKQTKLQKKLNNIQNLKEKAIEQEKLETALEYKQTEDKIIKQLNDLAKKIHKQNSSRKIKVTKKNILNVLSQKLNINKDLLEKNDWEILQDLEKKLNKKLIGQENTIKQLVNNLKKSYLVKQTNKPLLSLLFVGPSGVGKTELTKILAQELYYNSEALIKLDMSEFSEQHSVSKLLGSPAGYIGYEDRNPIIEKIQQNPYSVIVFDEIDKAHPDVIKLLLQILDEGKITDSRGKTTYFNHAIIILTTNVGANLFKSSGIGFDKNEQNNNLQIKIKDKIKEILSSAIISRLDDILIFQPLSKNSLNKILKNKIKELNKNLQKNQGLSIKISDKIINELIKDFYQPEEGVRILENKTQNIINNLIIDYLSSNQKNHKKILNIYKEKKAYYLN